jgi:hypothetical protein
LVGQDTTEELEGVTLGELVYIQPPDDGRYSGYETFSLTGLGVVVELDDNCSLSRYLLPTGFVKVLIDGEIGWFAPDEILRFNSGNFSESP